MTPGWPACPGGSNRRTGVRGTRLTALKLGTRGASSRHTKGPAKHTNWGTSWGVTRILHGHGSTRAAIEGRGVGGRESGERWERERGGEGVGGGEEAEARAV